VFCKTPIQKSGIRRILVRATNWVGDTVMTLPALEAVRENFPDGEITVLGKRWILPLLENHPAVDRVISIEKPGRFPADFREYLRVAGKIRNRRFDLAVLFQNAFEAAFLAWLGGVKLRLGYNTDGRGCLLTHRVARDRAVLEGHQVGYYLSILRAAGWAATDRDPVLHAAPGARREARRLLADCGVAEGALLVGLSPGAMFGRAKRWPAERFARIGDWAAGRWGAGILVMGSEKEASVCGRVCSAMQNRAVNLCGRTSLAVAVAVIERCGLFVTNDSGLMHVAAALGVPTVAVFGSTDPKATGPRGPRTRIVMHDTPCAPCLQRECPGDYQCLVSIGPEEVWQAMEEIRGETP